MSIADGSNVLMYCATENGTYTEPVQPSAMDIGYQDMDYNSGRSADGTMHRNKVGLKRKLTLTYPPMSYAVAHDILTLVVSDTVTDFYVQYFDPVTNGAKKLNVYVGDRTVPVYSTGLKLFNSMTFDLIEM